MTLEEANRILADTSLYIYERNGEYAWMSMSTECRGFQTVEEAYSDACSCIESGIC